MKQLVFVVLVVFNYAFAKAQNPPSQKVEPPTIGLKLMYGDMASFGDTQIKFKEVISDSRCPKDVQCVWAGEAKVLVEVYKNGTLDSEKELKFAGVKSIRDIINTQFLEIEALRLQPYPIAAVPKNPEAYYLVLSVREN